VAAAKGGVALEWPQKGASSQNNNANARRRKTLQFSFHMEEDGMHFPIKWGNFHRDNYEILKRLR